MVDARNAAMSQAPNSSNAAEAGKKDREGGGIPEGLWLRCPDCGDMLFRKVVEEAMWVCPNCDYHFRISARQRIEQLADPGSFEEMFEDLEPADPLRSVARKPSRTGSTPDSSRTATP